jgi:YVTN family beta-propeller protein
MKGRVKYLLFLTIGLIFSWETEAFSLLTPTELSLKTERICRECHKLDDIIYFDKTEEDWALVLESMQSYGARIQSEDIPQLASELAKHLPFELDVMVATYPYTPPGAAFPSILPFKLYIPNVADGSVSVVDTRTNKVVELISSFSNPHTSAVSHKKGFALVTNATSKSKHLTLIDVRTNEIITNIEVGKLPKHVELSRDEKYAYVANQADNTVSIVNVEERKEIAKIEVAQGPHVSKSDREDKHLWVTNEHAASVSVIDLEKKEVLDTITVGNTPMGLAFSLDNSRAFVANTASGTVSVIDVAKREVLKNITVGERPSHIEVSPLNGMVYVTVEGMGEVVVIDSTSLEVVNSINIGRGYRPHGILFNPNGRYAYITNQGNNSLSLIELSGIDSSRGRVISEIPVGRFPGSI